MKNIFILLLSIGIVAVAAVAMHQRKQLDQQNAKIVQIQTELTNAQNRLESNAEAAEKIALAEEKAQVLQKTVTELSSASAQQSKQVSRLEQSLAAEKTNASPVKGLAAMFKDPAMKDMIKSQQKAYIGPMIDKMYGSFFQQFNLTPEQTAYLKDLIQKKMLVASDLGMSMLDGSADASKQAELRKQIKEQTDAVDSQIKQFLGDDNYKQFQDYEKSTADRMQVSQFQDQFAGTATALSPDQQQQLIQAMADERNNFKWTTDFSNPNAAGTDVASMFTDEKVNQFAQQREQLDQQVIERARQILTPEQLTQFEAFQKAQRELQVNGMKMAAKMFGTKGQ